MSETKIGDVFFKKQVYMIYCILVCFLNPFLFVTKFYQTSCQEKFFICPLLLFFTFCFRFSEIATAKQLLNSSHIYWENTTTPFISPSPHLTTFPIHVKRLLIMLSCLLIFILCIMQILVRLLKSTFTRVWCCWT